MTVEDIRKAVKILKAADKSVVGDFIEISSEGVYLIDHLGKRKTRLVDGRNG